MLFKVVKVFVLFSLGIVFASCPALDRIDFKFDTEGPKLLDVQDTLSQTGDWYALQFNEPIRLSAPPPEPISMATSTGSSNSYVECAVDVSNPSRLIIFLPDGPNTIAPMDTITFTIPEGYLTDEVDNPNAQTDSIIDVTGTSTETPHVFEQIIRDGTIPTFSDSVQDSDRPFIWSALKNYSGYEVHDVVYVTESGGGAGSNDGSSWATAAAASDLKTKLEGLGASEPSKVSFLLVGVGTYSAKALEMKNNVAIVGGWKADGGWERPDTGTTIFDGGAGGSTVTDRVFYNMHGEATPLTDTALLHSVTVRNGNVDGPGGGMYNMYASPTLIDVTFSNNTANNNSGGGMYNEHSSPTLIDVTFSNNTANNNSGGGMYNAHSSPKLFNVKFLENSVTTGEDPHSGGGMANSNSSPTLTNVTFSRNVATKNGGGMYNMFQSSPTLLNVKFLNNTADRGGGMNNKASAPTLINVTFSKNEAKLFGGGMRNQDSSPLLVNATFSANTAKTSGGGMYNDDSSSPTLVNATFSANTADISGGGMYNDNNGGDGPLVINSLFWANMGSSTTTNHQIFMHNDLSGGEEKLSLYNCIVQHGVDGAGGIGRTNDPNNGGATITINGATTTGSTDPLLDTTLGENGGFVQTHALTGANSSAIDKGLYVQESVSKNILYYSKDGSDWYSDLGTQISDSLPADAYDLTATDARGYSRVDRPDIGAYEY